MSAALDISTTARLSLISEWEGTVEEYRQKVRVATRRKDTLLSWGDPDERILSLIRSCDQEIMIASELLKGPEERLRALLEWQREEDPKGSKIRVREAIKRVLASHERPLTSREIGVYIHEYDLNTRSKQLPALIQATIALLISDREILKHGRRGQRVYSLSRQHENP